MRKSDFIQLVNYSGEVVYIKKSNIEGFYKLSTLTKVNTLYQSYSVRETPEQILKFICEETNE